MEKLKEWKCSSQYWESGWRITEAEDENSSGSFLIFFPRKEKNEGGGVGTFDVSISFSVLTVDFFLACAMALFKQFLFLLLYMDLGPAIKFPMALINNSMQTSTRVDNSHPDGWLKKCPIRTFSYAGMKWKVCYHKFYFEPHTSCLCLGLLSLPPFFFIL